jgi:hypothetical protein
MCFAQKGHTVVFILIIDFLPTSIHNSTKRKSKCRQNDLQI